MHLHCAAIRPKFLNVPSFSSPNPVTYSWIGHGLQSGPTLAFSLLLSNFKTKTSFESLIKKIRGRFLYFFKKSKNELVRPKKMCLAILAEIRSFSDNSDMLTISQYTSIWLTGNYEVKELCNKSIDRTSYRLYSAAGLPKKLICRETEALQKLPRPPY